MSGPECGDSKDTGYGFSAWCSLPAGEHEIHESADFLWADDSKLAALKVLP